MFRTGKRVHTFVAPPARMGTHSSVRLTRFPMELGMEPLSWFELQSLRQPWWVKIVHTACTAGELGCAQRNQAGQISDAARDRAAQSIIIQQPANRTRVSRSSSSCAQMWPWQSRVCTRAGAQDRQAGQGADAAWDRAAQLVRVQVNANNNDGRVLSMRCAVVRVGGPARTGTASWSGCRCCLGPCRSAGSSTRRCQQQRQAGAQYAGRSRAGGRAHTHRDCNLARLPMVLGIVPLSWFESKSLPTTTTG